MFQNLLKGLKIAYTRTVTSIAFIPAIIAIAFLLLSVLMIEFDFSSTGKSIKSNLSWLKLQDASTARSISSAIVAGIISLTVFSFSMVMILLSQVASQMSNRVLDKLIGNRFQQIVLGFYIGTIVYALFLLSTIRDIDSGIYIPAISTYVLIAFTIVDIFLFIYFLHYITQTVKYETIIHKIHDTTIESIKSNCLLNNKPPTIFSEINGQEIRAFKSGTYQGFDQKELITLCVSEDAVVSMHFPVGTFVIENTPLLHVDLQKNLSPDFEQKLSQIINIHRGQDISVNYYYGFKHLMEVAVKALSPGINDPGTAAISLQALANLIAYKMRHFPETHIRDNDGTVRVIIVEKTFDEVFEEFVLPIWDYGKEDRLIQSEMLNILPQLLKYQKQPAIIALLQQVNEAINHKKIEMTH